MSDAGAPARGEGVRGSSRPRVGILGGGQLGRMTAEAARDLGVEVTILEREAGSPAGQIVGPSHEIVGDWRDATARAALAERVDLITLESEFVAADALQWFVDRGTPVYPTPETLRVVQDKFLQKETLFRAGLAVPRFHPVRDESDLLAAGADLGWPLLLKARRLGYDGHGNVTVADPGESPAAIRSLVGPTERRDADLDLYVEEFVRFAGEIAVMVTRGRDGSIEAYPIVDTFQQNHICHEVVAPARIPSGVAEQARRIAIQAVEAVDAVGVVGVEMFWRDDGAVLLNELAPRPHNSGHYTIEACRTSQFANHLRAVLGWPLGPVDLVAPGAAMVNLLGTRTALANPSGVEPARAVGRAYPHLYGKRDVRVGRKMGHITALGDTPEGALATARRAARRIVW
ncbi:MAG: 5-(carboxyamino)imidazole ribonucleotide synthase [Chloroflexota bacterium]